MTALEHLREAEQYAVWAADWYRTGKEEDQQFAVAAAAIGQLHVALAAAVARFVELGLVPVNFSSASPAGEPEGGADGG